MCAIIVDFTDVRLGGRVSELAKLTKNYKSKLKTNGNKNSKQAAGNKSNMKQVKIELLSEYVSFYNRLFCNFVVF